MEEVNKHLKGIRKKMIIYSIGIIFVAWLIMYGTSALATKYNWGTSTVEASADEGKVGPWSSYFTVIDTWESKGNHFYIVYADNNHVMYMIVVGYNSSGITALYNPDGSLQIYEED